MTKDVPTESEFYLGTETERRTWENDLYDLNCLILMVRTGNRSVAHWRIELLGDDPW